MRQFPRAFVCALLALLSAPATASDWYVDAVNGSNSNGGTSPADAWRSITWAVAHTPTTGVQRILIASGSYGHTNGEVFPIHLRPDLQLVGAPGSARPVIGQTGVPTTFEMQFAAGSTVPPSVDTLLENLVLARGNRGLRLSVSGGSFGVVLRDVKCDKLQTCVLSFVEGSGSLQLTVERLVFRNPPQGSLSDSVHFSANSTARSTFVARDCEVVGGRYGFQVVGNLDARFERCRVEGAAMACVQLGQLQSFLPHTEFESCVLADSSNFGCRFSTLTGGSARFVRCTIADNNVSGIYATNSGSTPASIEVEQCILSNDLWDLVLPANRVVRDSLVRDGQFTGANGNFSADPQFVAPQDGDWSLRWSSPAIDRIATPVAELDIARRARDVDGDLDLVERSDLGAHEFRPLGLARTARIGGTFALESWGPQSNASVIYWARAAPVSPTATPFGEFDLPLGLTRVFAATTVASSAPTTLLRPIPSNAALVGQTYSFQALVDSAASPTGRAYTNVAPITFVP
jgi:hypothetical protein